MKYQVDLEEKINEENRYILESKLKEINEHMRAAQKIHFQYEQKQKRIKRKIIPISLIIWWISIGIMCYLFGIESIKYFTIGYFLGCFLIPLSSWISEKLS